MTVPQRLWNTVNATTNKRPSTAWEKLHWYVLSPNGSCRRQWQFSEPQGFWNAMYKESVHAVFFCRTSTPEETSLIEV